MGNNIIIIIIIIHKRARIVISEKSEMLIF